MPDWRIFSTSFLICSMSSFGKYGFTGGTTLDKVSTLKLWYCLSALDGNKRSAD